MQSSAGCSKACIATPCFGREDDTLSGDRGFCLVLFFAFAKVAKLSAHRINVVGLKGVKHELKKQKVNNINGKEHFVIYFFPL